MFYTEEDISPAVNAATKLFGNAGTYLNGNNILYNVSVATKDFGKIWYGDISTEDLSTSCEALSNLIQKDVYVFTAHNEYDYKTAQRFEPSSLKMQ